MAKILITAENFAFGPIGKVLVIAELLKEAKHDLYFLGYGTSLQLAKKFPFEEIYPIDTDENDNRNKLLQLIPKFDLVVSSMDVPTVKIANELNIPTVWLDCLFWFWDDLPNEVLKVDLFVKENLFVDTEKKLKLSSQVTNLVNVGPIIGSANRNHKKNQLLISFGGAEATHSYKIGRDTNYPKVMTNILYSSIDSNLYDHIIIATNENVVKELKDDYKNSNFSFQCLPYEKFIQEIANSEILLTTPGLVTAEIAFEFKTPIIFIPASNNSQYMQLEKFRNLKLAPASIHMSDFISNLNLDSEPVDQSTQLVLDQLRILEKSEKLQNQIGNKIKYLLSNKEDWSNKAVTDGKEYINAMGGNGSHKATESINKLIEKL